MNEKAVAAPKKLTAAQYLKKNWPLYVMLIIPMIYVIVFKYVPMAGLAIAFKDFSVFKCRQLPPKRQHPQGQTEASKSCFQISS